jgi:hypothetical protein
MLFARALTNGMRWFTPDLLRCADGYSEGDADFDVDEVISDTAEPAAAAPVVDYVDAQIVEDDPAEIIEEKSPEERRQDKVDHIANLCKWLNEHKDSIAWKKSTLTEYINHKYDTTDGVASLAFKELDETIEDLTAEAGGVDGREGGIAMNRHQEIAIRNNCRLGIETARPAFCYLLPGGKISVVLSVNSGYE